MTHLERNLDPIREQLVRHGGVLLRGFSITTPEEFSRIFEGMCGQSLNYRQRSTQRKEYADRVYSSTEYDSRKSIQLHSENSFQTRWPARIAFWCVKTAQGGGATPVATNKSVYDALSENIRSEFESRQIMYVRNYGGGLEMQWQEAFQTEDRGEVEGYCRNNGIEFDWLEDDILRTRQVLPATVSEVNSQSPVWFNQAHLFHASQMEKDVRLELEVLLDAKSFPRHCFFGDGGMIPDSYFDEIRLAYSRNTRTFDWRDNDLMILDNVQVCHGREPFEGERRVLVAMAQSTSFSDVGPDR